MSLTIGLVMVTDGCRPRAPTYHPDVAPILARACGECHRVGGVAPVPRFDDYDGARSYAEPIKLAMQARQMPPWGADNTGLCGTWTHARWLSTDDIAVVAKWQASGSPEGPAGASEQSDSKSMPEPFHADAAVSTGGVYQPGLGSDGYRCFVADPGLNQDHLLSAIRVESDDPRAVAQVTLFALDSAAADAQADGLDRVEEGLGYSCYGTARVNDSRLVASWSWPAPVLRLPPGVGVPLYARRKLVVQIHYDIAFTSNRAATATRVGLEFNDGAREAEVVTVRADGFLAPGQKYVALETRQRLGKRGRIIAVAPRMHIRGQTMQLQIEHENKSSCVAEFDHWHFNDEQLFVREKPVDVKEGDSLRLSCSYNTTGRVAPTPTGQGIDDEECVAYVMVRD